MRFTCIALAAVALALAKPHQAPGLVSGTSYNTYALSAETRTEAASASASTSTALTASNGVIDFTPLPAADDGADGIATVGTALIASNDTTRCMTVRRTNRAARVVLVGCTTDASQAFSLVGGQIRTADMCVTAPDDRDNAVRPVSLEPCNGSIAQQWAATESGEFRGYRGKCLTAAAGLQRRQGTPLAVRGCMKRSDQQWAQRAVTARRARVDSIRLNAVALSVGAGRSTKVNAIAIDAGGHEIGDEPITWASADPAVAVVLADGTVTGVGAGSTAIIALAQGRVKSVSVEVRGAQYAGAESGTATYGAQRP